MAGVLPPSIFSCHHILLKLTIRQVLKMFRHLRENASALKSKHFGVFLFRLGVFKMCRSVFQILSFWAWSYQIINFEQSGRSCRTVAGLLQPVSWWYTASLTLVTECMHFCLKSKDLGISAQMPHFISMWSKILSLFYLPPYSPEPNLAETLWRILKGKWIRLVDYNTKDSLFYCINRALASVGTSLFVNYSYL